MSNLPAERRAAQLNRDAALRRVVRARTGLIAGSVGVTAGLVALVADTAPGKTYHAVRVSSPRALHAAKALPPLKTPRQLGLKAANPQAIAPAQTGTSTQASATSSQPGVTATQPAVTATQPAVTATQPAVTATEPAAPAPVVSGGS